jgi:ferredoxin
MDKWPLYYIDPETCIDCGACVPECPYEAIFEESAVPTDFTAAGGEYLAKPEGTAGFSEVYEGENDKGQSVVLKATRILDEGEVVDLTAEIAANAAYFKSGTGYKALEM